MTNAELVVYYTNLLILQYKKLEKAPAHIEALLEISVIYEIIEDVKNGFDVNTAIGVQQDVLGKYLDIDRVISGIPYTENYFGFMLYGDDPNLSLFFSFMLYGDTPPDVKFFKYGDQEDILVLTDDEYRTVQLFRIIQLNSLHSLKVIDDLLFEAFGTTIELVDNEDMTIEYIFPLTNKRLATILKSENLLPAPMGVEVFISFS